MTPKKKQMFLSALLFCTHILPLETIEYKHREKNQCKEHSKGTTGSDTVHPFVFLALTLP